MTKYVKRFIRTFTLVVLFTFILYSPDQAEAEAIRIWGPVINELYPGKILDHINVIIEVQGTDTKILQADYNKDNKGWYDKICTTEYLNKDISVRLLDNNYAQVNAIEFTPTKSGRYENTLIIKHKKNIAEDKLTQASELERDKEFEAAVKLVSESIELDPKPRAYFRKVQLISKMLRVNLKISNELLLFGEDVKHDEYFKQFSLEDRYKFYLQFGTAFVDINDLSQRIDLSHTYYDLAIEAFNEAINLKSEDVKAYQGTYLVQKDMGYYSEMISTIKSYFRSNDDITNENTIKVLLTDWVTGIEELTGYPRDTLNQYIESIECEKRYKSEWEDLRVILCKYESYYRESDAPVNLRLRKAKLLSEKILGGKP